MLIVLVFPGTCNKLQIGEWAGGAGEEGVRTILKAKMFSHQCCALHYF